MSVSLNTQQVISETSLSRQLIALILITKNNKTKHTYTANTRYTAKTALANKQATPWFDILFDSMHNVYFLWEYASNDRN